ncbi:MAG: adenylate/guanylate cyclase domain-containing protein [Marinifilaceae bacterium]
MWTKRKANCKSHLGIFAPLQIFREPLHPEFLKIERKRVGVIVLLFILSFAVIPLLHELVPNLLRNTVNRPEFFRGMIIWAGIFFVFELSMFFRINHAIKKNQNIPRLILIPNILMEFSIPALVLYQGIKFDQSLLVMEYDGLTFYFVLLMLSAMHLNFRISFLAGVLACVGYFGVSFLGMEMILPEGDIAQMREIYAARSLGLLFAGFIAGIVASEIRKRVDSHITTLEDQREIETLLGQQLSQDVARELIEHRNEKVGHKVEGAIMFLDIRNFTAMADHQLPEETIEFQNAIFDPLIRIIEKNHGIIHQILGDGFMASFGIAVKNPQHVQDAYQAGIEIIEIISHLRAGLNGEKTRVGIGLHCGEVITGNIGNEIRKQFSLAGKNVILAARLEQLNKQFNSQFLVSRSVAKQLENDNRLESLGPVKVKGIDEKVEVLKVV